MWNILYMTMTSLVAAGDTTGKIIKIGLSVFERGENLLQNGMVFVFKLSQSSGIVLQS